MAVLLTGGKGNKAHDSSNVICISRRSLSRRSVHASYYWLEYGFRRGVFAAASRKEVSCFILLPRKLTLYEMFVSPAVRRIISIAIFVLAVESGIGFDKVARN